MNAYLDVIMNALLVFPLMAMIFALPYIIYNYRKYGIRLYCICCAHIFS